MNAVGAIFVAIMAIYTFALPRRTAILPLLLGALYMTRGQVLEIGPANFTIPQLLVTAGFLRAMSRGERITGGLHTVDKLVLLWAAVLIGTSAFHTDDAWLYRAGIVWTELGCYFLFRIFITNLNDLADVFKAICVLAMPMAFLMLYEKASGQNPFGSLGGVVATSLIRDGNIRAAGPFAHPILAGTTGAAIIGMGLALRKISLRHTFAAWISGGSIVLAATSSGPILMVGFTIAALFVWMCRHHMRALRWTIVAGLLVLNEVMKDPIYFLMARIDISGGSQGYFRAQLIRSSLEHFDEWWMAGTDYTRHWMATGNHANTRHTDITNHLLGMGVLGGMPLMLVFLAIVAFSFRDVGRALAQHAKAPQAQQVLIWGLGAILFGYFMNFWTISLFDQSVMFLYLTFASIQSVVGCPAALATASPHIATAAAMPRETMASHQPGFPSP
jgi:hypothetical protein